MSTPTNRHSFRILFLRGAGVGGHLLARTLRKRGHTVHLVRPKNALAYAEKLTGYDFVLASCFHHAKSLQLLKSALEACALSSPEAKLVLGGPGFTCQPEAFLRDLKADYGLRGEADKTIEELFDLFERFGAKPAWKTVKVIHGAAYRAKNNRVYLNLAMPHLTQEQVEQLPIIPRFIRSRKCVDVYTQRGCSNRCAFCSNNLIFGGEIRSSKVDDIIAALRKIATNHPGILVRFMSERFLPREQAIELCKKIVEEGLNDALTFFCYYTVGSFLKDGDPDKEMIEALANANFQYFAIGVESFSDRMLRDFGKPQTGRQAFRVLGALRSFGIHGGMYIIRTSPNMRLFDLVNNYCGNVATSTNMSYMRWSKLDSGMLFASPGTSLFDRWADEPGMLLDPNSLRAMPRHSKLRTMAKKRVMNFIVRTRDEALVVITNGLHALWVMEARYAYLSGLHRQLDGKETNELRKLKAELPRARKQMRKLPKESGERVMEIIEDRRALSRIAVLKHPELFDEMRRTRPELLAKIETYESERLYRENGRVAVWQHLEGAVRVKLYDLSNKYPDILPRRLVEEELGLVFDDLVSKPAAFQALWSPHMPDVFAFEAYRDGSIERLVETGKDEFVSSAMSARDPFNWVFTEIVGFQLISAFGNIQLRDIDPRKDSRPQLGPFLNVLPLHQLRLLNQLTVRIPDYPD